MGLLLIGVVAILIVLQYPGKILNSKRIPWIVAQLKSSGIDLRYDSGDLDARSLSFLKKSIAVAFEGICVDMKQSGFEGCFDSLSARVEIDLGKFPEVISVIGPVAVLGGEVKVFPAPEPKTQPKKDEGGGGVPGWIGNPRIEPIRVQIRDYRILTGDAPVRGSLDLKARTEKGWTALLDATLKTGPLRVALDLSANQVGKFEDLRADYKFSTRVAQAGKSVRAHASGRVHPEGGTLRLNAKSANLAKGVREVTLRDCDFSLALGAGRKKEGANDSRMKADCPIRLVLDELPIQGVPDLKLPSKTGLRFSAQVDGPFPPDMNAELAGRAQIKIDPILTPLMSGGGSGGAEFQGVPNQFPEGWELDGAAELQVKVPQFQKWVALLRKTPYAVPAPINPLEGTIKISTSGRTDLDKGEVPIQLQTRLRSKDQKLDLDASGGFAWATVQGVTQPRLNMNLQLTDVQLALPRLELEAPPRFFPDSRIQVADKKVEEPENPKSAFKYHVRVFTPPANPLRALSNLAQTPVPIRLALELDDAEEPRGAIEVAKFPLELFRREAELESFRLTLMPESDENPIQGSVRLNYVDYVVRVILVGTAENPRVELTSDPPLSENQLISVLFFGRTMDELDSDESQSVGQVRSALADGAVGLASLYFLAATPIQSVGYDPESGVFSAKVRVAEGTSLNVGSGEGQLQTVGVQKRLGRRWRLTTDYAPTNELNSQSGMGGILTAFLEWHNRY